MTTTPSPEAQRAAARAVRVLTVDAVREAGIGHTGLPLGCAELGTVLFSEFLKHDPTDPSWPDRDRFVLSAGHGSMLLYSLLYLSGYAVTLEDIKYFRKLGSITPGHPEFGVTPGVETTTGPLGQGLGMAVGMALAERMLAARFGEELVDHRTYVLASDGDLMEGVASEAASLAGHLKLGRLVCLYDDNGITIDGKTDLAFSEDVAKRFEAYGWAVQRADGHDLDAVRAALRDATAGEDRPQLIMCKTHIGQGSPAVDTSAAHGALSGDQVDATREALGWTLPPFELPDGIDAAFAGARERGAEARQAWETRRARALRDPDTAARWRLALERGLPADWQSLLPRYEAGAELPTRKASGAVLNALAASLPTLVGGSADLAGSNNTTIKDGGLVAPGDYAGRNIAFGVREHGMAAVANGISLHGGFRPYVATFLVFSDYLRPSLRLSALMHQPVTYVFTHDSVFVGEDGPTHQPVEHLAALRAVPNTQVWRPADARETVAAWQAALERSDGPVVMALTRQNVPTLEGDDLETKARRGGYVLVDCEGEPELVILATGSEVALAAGAARTLQGEGRRVRAVSLPCLEVFAAQDDAYRSEVLGSAPRLGVEAGVRHGLASVLRPEDAFHGMEGFGASANYKVLAQHFGFTQIAVAEAARRLLG